MQTFLTPGNFLSPALSRSTAPRDPAKTAGRTLGRWARTAIRQWQRNKLIATLEAMDDWVLHDIGIYRGDIRDIVNSFDDRELGMVPFAAPIESHRGK
ncbi:protein of unknown function [Primorskyibacter flagellatus]|uniref:YjiS-like domain-containing protein n=2 Tax=Primorskyibacter flagellatus TaxID=1387277 RepID=A0A1W2DDG1_9RHOB|nr:protein of unknown function [Primorskyibacter flagellatus]